MTEESYTQHDIQLAEKLGGLTSSIQHLHDKVDSVLADQQRTTNAIWKRIDEHSEQIENHSKNFVDHLEKIGKLDSAFKWIIGIGLGFQAAFGALMYFLKKN